MNYIKKIKKWPQTYTDSKNMFLYFCLCSVCESLWLKNNKEINMSDLKDVILEYVEDEYLDEDDDIEVTYDTPLISGGIVDSFSMVSLKRFLETKYKIQIPDAKATPEAFDTVDNIVKLLKEFGVE
jgi:acyl carrier protein